MGGDSLLRPRGDDGLGALQFSLDDGGKTRRLTIGPTNVLKQEDARAEAEKKLQELYRGIDPKTVRRSAAKLTLRVALDEYLAARPMLRERSKEEYRGAIERRFAHLLDRPLRDVTPEMIEARHREIQRGIEARDGARRARAARLRAERGGDDRGPSRATRRVEFKGHAAGDAARVPHDITLASADGIIAGLGVHHSLIAEDSTS
jgi:hypothetical protein